MVVVVPEEVNFRRKVFLLVRAYFDPPDQLSQFFCCQVGHVLNLQVIFNWGHSFRSVLVSIVPVQDDSCQ